MTTADRLWLVAHSPDYTEFAETWIRFGAGHPVSACRLAGLGTELHRQTLRAAGAAEQLELEAAVRALMPELDQYLQFVERSLRPAPTVGA